MSNKITKLKVHYMSKGKGNYTRGPYMKFVSYELRHKSARRGSQLIRKWLINWCLTPPQAIFQLYRGVNWYAKKCRLSVGKHVHQTLHQSKPLAFDEGFGSLEHCLGSCKVNTWCNGVAYVENKQLCRRFTCGSSKSVNFDSIFYKNQQRVVVAAIVW
jgi:hypothetical protein